MKLAFKVLLLIVLIAVGKWEKENHSIITKNTKSVYSPVYSQNTNLEENRKTVADQEMRKILVNYNNY